MAKVLVTGGAGFIGSHLAEELSKKHEVTILDDFSAGKESNITGFKHKLIKGDIRDEETLVKAMKGQEYVFHLAAIVSVPYSVEHPKKTHEVNATGTLKVLHAAKEAGVKRVIYASSAAVYGDEPSLPKTEESPLKPQTPYALQKLTSEYYCLMYHSLYNMETVILRNFNVYGPRQDPSSPYSGVITKFVSIIKDGKQPTIYGDGMQTRDFVYVGDVVQAYMKAMTAKNATGQIFNIGTGIQVSLKELLVHLGELLGKKITPKHEAGKQGDIKHSVADISKAKKLLNYKPELLFHEGLQQTIKL